MSIFFSILVDIAWFCRIIDDLSEHILKNAGK
jgi:hypothetical protein